MTCLPQLVCMHGLPASDPAPFLEARDLLFLVMLYDQYTLLSSNKHDFTNPSSDPSPCRLSLSFIQSHPSGFSFGSPSLWQGGSSVRH